MLDQSIVFFAPDDLALATAVQPHDVSKQGLTFKKQLIYVGDFLKEDSVEKQEFSVDEKLIDHWVRTGNAMLSLGVKVPVPLKHTDDPEANRGYVLEFYKLPDEKGRTSLYGLIEFRDVEAAKLAMSTDVSIFVPPYHTVASVKKTFTRPVMHVALTNTPVINDMGGFETIKASFSGSGEMSALKELAKDAGIPNYEQMDDAALTAALKKKMKPQQPPQNNPPKPEPPKPAVTASNEPAKVNAVVLSTVKSARETSIDALLLHKDGPKITKAQADSLKQQYCGDGLKLSMEAGVDDGFDSMIKTLSLNPSQKIEGEQTGPQDEFTLELATSADYADPKKNPILAATQEMQQQANPFANSAAQPQQSADAFGSGNIAWD